jgi:hypothetical protein
MDIIDQFFKAVDNEKMTSFIDGVDDDDETEDAANAGQKPVDDRRTKNTPPKKGFFNFG